MPSTYVSSFWNVYPLKSVHMRSLALLCCSCTILRIFRCRLGRRRIKQKEEEKPEDEDEGGRTDPRCVHVIHH